MPPTSTLTLSAEHPLGVLVRSGLPLPSRFLTCLGLSILGGDAVAEGAFAAEFLHASPLRMAQDQRLRSAPPLSTDSSPSAPSSAALVAAATQHVAALQAHPLDFVHLSMLASKETPTYAETFELAAAHPYLPAYARCRYSAALSALLCLLSHTLSVQPWWFRIATHLFVSAVHRKHLLPQAEQASTTC